jgi:hypothetical protein
MVLAHVIQLERWLRWMSVMLKKTLGVTLVTKLQAILLMEADFNATNKILYGVRMMGQARSYNLMPDEIYIKKNRMADNGTLTKTLFFDMVRQSRVSAAITSVNASNCYDRIAHVIASLIFQSFGVPKSAIESMLKAIEDMKFFLRTGFGNSTRLAGGGVQVKLQGLTQGNRASPVGWAVISIVILRAHGKKGHGATVRCPIASLVASISAILYVDNTDLLHINLDQDETAAEAHAAIQDSMTSWGELLIATGGALKPEKCFYSVMWFKRIRGEWRYRDNSLNGIFGMTVPLLEGGCAFIAHHPITDLEKMLGAMTPPNGDSLSVIHQMQAKAKHWVDSVRNGHLHRVGTCGFHWEPNSGHGWDTAYVPPPPHLMNWRLPCSGNITRSCLWKG